MGNEISLEALGELGQAETLGKFSVEGKLNVDNVVKSYIELEKMHGNSVKIPGEDATVEEIAAFRKRLGVPDDVAGYEIDLSGADDFGKKTMEGFLKRVHGEGLSKAHVKSVLEFVNKDMPDMLKAAQAATLEKGTTALKEEWGDDFEKNMLDAKRARDEIAGMVKGGDAFVKLMNDKPELGNNPVLAKIFHQVSKVMQEGKFITGRLTLTDADIDKEIADLEADPATYDQSSPKYRSNNDRRTALYKKKYPGK